MMNYYDSPTSYKYGGRLVYLKNFSFIFNHKLVKILKTNIYDNYLFIFYK